MSSPWPLPVHSSQLLSPTRSPNWPCPRPNPTDLPTMLHNTDINKELSLFHTRLLTCGHISKKLLPLFKEGINNAISNPSQTPEQRDAIKKAKVGKSEKTDLPPHPLPPPKPLIWAARQGEPQPADQLGGTAHPNQEVNYCLSLQP
jgi:hypothetical protein